MEEVNGRGGIECMLWPSTLRVMVLNNNEPGAGGDCIRDSLGFHSEPEFQLINYLHRGYCAKFTLKAKTRPSNLSTVAIKRFYFCLKAYMNDLRPCKPLSARATATSTLNLEADGLA